MTKKNIIRMAWEANLPSCHLTHPKALERFAAIVAAHEREECAKIVENYCGAWDDQGYALANAIRARGQE